MVFEKKVNLIFIGGRPRVSSNLYRRISQNDLFPGYSFRFKYCDRFHQLEPLLQNSLDLDQFLIPSHFPFGNILGIDCVKLINRYKPNTTPVVYSSISFQKAEAEGYMDGQNKCRFFTGRASRMVEDLNKIHGFLVSEIMRKINQQGVIESLSEELILPEQKLLLLDNDIKIINQNFHQIIVNDPNEIYNLSPRQFEELIADLFEKKGYKVKLTPSTRDGGKDIYAEKRDLFNNSYLYAIECKKYSPENKVGRPHVQKLLGVVEAEKLSGGIIATTSFFTKDALNFRETMMHRIFLNDYYDLMSLIKK